VSSNAPDEHNSHCIVVYGPNGQFLNNQSKQVGNPGFQVMGATLTCSLKLKWLLNLSITIQSKQVSRTLSWKLVLSDFWYNAFGSVPANLHFGPPPHCCIATWLLCLPRELLCDHAHGTLQGGWQILSVKMVASSLPMFDRHDSANQNGKITHSLYRGQYLDPSEKRWGG
jgi:hypothetical protein